MAEQKDMTWAELERTAKNRLKQLMGTALEADRVQLDACIFVLTRDLEYLKNVDKAREEE